MRVSRKTGNLLKEILYIEKRKFNLLEIHGQEGSNIIAKHYFSSFERIMDNLNRIQIQTKRNTLRLELTVLQKN
jgi:hypothetical protein